jgi:hypothetical protein
MKKLKAWLWPNSASTGTQLTRKSIEQLKLNLRPMIQSQGFVVHAASPNSVPDSSTLVTVVLGGTVPSVQSYTRVVLAESLFWARLHKSSSESLWDGTTYYARTNMIWDINCIECKRPVDPMGTYTLNLCSYHDDLVLVCDDCKLNHDAMHELSGEVML